MGVDLVRVHLVGGHLIKIQLLKVWKTLTTAVSVQSRVDIKTRPPNFFVRVSNT